MTYDLVSTLLGMAIGFAVAYMVHRIWRLRHTRTIRHDAVRRSHAVLSGKAFEQLAPFHHDFPFDPRDARFLGSPVDFVVFDGLSEGTVRRVVFVEVKTGWSHLSNRERQIRDVVHGGRVEWSELREPLDRKG